MDDRRFVPPLAIFGSSSRVCTIYFIPMRSRTSRIIAIVILVTCFVCPLVDMFDNWDHAMQTGNDTEYGLVVFGLCVGAVYALARFVVRLGPVLSSITVGPNSPGIQGSLLFLIHPIALDSASGSPPLNLRI
jgi:hypothetical protein